MTDELDPGIWEALLTESLSAQLTTLARQLAPELHPLRDVEAADRLSRHLAMLVAKVIESRPEDRRSVDGVALVRDLVDQLVILAGERDSLAEMPAESGQVLHAILRRLPTGEIEHLERPLTPILDTTLLTHAPGEPDLGHEIRSEVHSASSIDVVMAFVRHSGILPLLEVLKRHCDNGGRLRILTTTYTGSTEARALDELAAVGAEVRVSYDTSVTRLHAKAWVFHRAPATTTAYIGSSNLTYSAQVTGLEWNVRVSGARNPDVIAKMTATFDSYWESRDFVPYEHDEFLRRTEADAGDRPLLLSPLEVELRPFQEALLERIALARSLGHHKNLLVSATGTGKTVMAAVDYARLRPQMARDRLLFVAHREEILEQSCATFRHVLRDGAFGELWVRNSRPRRFEHVFASVQSLSAAGLENLEPESFDVVIVDEFHHAAAPTYRALIDHLVPIELLGLTATPERADGLDVLGWFEGRISAELRLWDAIDEQYLAPFAYYGIADSADLREVPWRRGRGYDPSALSGVLTADHVLAHLVIEQVRQKVTNAAQMKALGFCVGIDHARFMAERFNQAGLPSVAIWGETPVLERQAALRDLQTGRITTVFSVDLFNEGVDLPSVDTLLLLRPTDSATLFLQQLGRGLRRTLGKSVCTVLDFIGQHRREFRFDRRFRALLGGSRLAVERQVVAGFPFLPAGCSIDLDPVAQRRILDSIRNALPTTWRERQSELLALGDVALAEFLASTGLDLDDLYANRHSWSELRRSVGLPTLPPGPGDSPLLPAVGRLRHVDDLERINSYRDLIVGREPPDVKALSERQRRLLRMLTSSLLSALSAATPVQEGLAHLWAHPQVRGELVELLDLLPDRIEHVQHPLGVDDRIPLRVHARYTRAEILAAFDVGDGIRAPTWQEGVRWVPSARCDLLAFTLDKTRGAFSPTTRYRDYAISPELIHWESQSTTALGSETGRRYVTHASGDPGSRSHIVLFARLNTDERSFWCLGPATHVRHEGERPIAITWRLDYRLPMDLYTSFAAAVA